MTGRGSLLSDKVLWANWKKVFEVLHKQLTEDMVAVARQLKVPMDDIGKAGGSSTPPAKRKNLTGSGPLFELQCAYWHLATASIEFRRPVGSIIQTPAAVGSLTMAHRHIRAAEGHVVSGVSAEADIVKQGMAVLTRRSHAKTEQAKAMAVEYWWPKRSDPEFVGWKQVGIAVWEWLQKQGVDITRDTVQRHLSAYAKANGFEGYSRRKKA